MSTYWDIGCRTCSEDAGLHVNHGEELMEGIITAREAIVAVGAIGEFDVETWRQMEGNSAKAGAEFAKKHLDLDHEVFPHSEYGDWLDLCNERINCQLCDARHKCGLPKSHHGPCDRAVV